MSSIVKVVPFDRDIHTNFILDAILKSNRTGFDGAHSLTGDYYAWQEPYWKRVLGLPETRCVVATSPESEDQFIGFAIGREFGIPQADTKLGALDYLYTKNAFREFGVAKAMVAALQLPAIRHYSNLPTGWKWRKAREYDWKYEPHALLARLYGDTDEHDG